VSKKKRAWLLRFLWRRCRGVCQGCQSPTGVAHVLVPQGWVLLEGDGLLADLTTGTLLPLATIEHLVPRARGGSDDLNNLTLYCWSCNQKTAVWGQGVVTASNGLSLEG
jgi:hypothetical protein